MRVKAVIAYNGAPFYGFQSQTTTPKTVMGALTRNAHKLGINSKIIGSGRTDKGVHATGQVIHFDLPIHWQNDLQKLKIMFNRHLHPYIQIKVISPVNDTFHARYDAKKRFYRYILKATQPTPFEIAYCHHLPSLDSVKLLRSLQCFEGKHDFAMFHKTGSAPFSTIRTIYKTDIYRFGNYHIITLQADGFLRAQVRMIVAAAIKTMQGDLTIEQIKEQLENKNVHTTSLAPPQALYLSRIIY